MSVEEHRQTAIGGLQCAVITVSDSRGREDDPSGDLIATTLAEAGHLVASRQCISDDEGPIRAALLAVRPQQLVILTGGTGTTDRDVTWRVVGGYIEEPLPAFAVLFAQLSYQDVGPAAMLSRACAGLLRRPEQVIFALPGSSKACRLALEKLIVPEVGHLFKHLIRH